jgi:hypothetical protein
MMNEERDGKKGRKKKDMGKKKEIKKRTEERN